MKSIFLSEPKIHTTGAFLQPAKITDSTGKHVWVWYVSEFTDDSFLNGEIYNPHETANSKEKLFLEPL